MYDCFILCDNYDKLEFTPLYPPWKVSKYRVFSGPCFPVFSPNTGKYVIEKTPYLDTFHTVLSDLTECIRENRFDMLPHNITRLS